MRSERVGKWLVGVSMGASLLLATTATPSHATAVTLTGSGTGSRSASATFDNVSFFGFNFLQVTLTNTATYDPTSTSQILTAIFFNLPGNPTLTRVGALLAEGSTVKGINPDPVNLGGEWAYRTGLSVGGYSQGISSAALGLFGSGDRFVGNNLQGPDSPEGIQYGISTENDTSGNDGSGLSGQQLVRNTVVFYLGGISAGFDPLQSITSVRFQYGTDLASSPYVSSDYHGPATRVPYPSSLALLGFGALGAVLIVRRSAVVALIRR
jgi:hypothetical protein